MARVKYLTSGSPMKLILGFSLPLLFGFAFQQLYSFVDAAIVGRFLGASALAAVGSTGSLNFLIIGFCAGICSGFAIPIAQTFGANDQKSMRAYVTHSIYLSAVVSVVLAVVTALLTPQMLRWMNTPEEILDDAIAYIQLIFAAMPVTVLYNLSGGILRSLGDSKTPVIYLALASVINIVLDLVFILYFGMGVAGAAWATIISQLVSGVGCVLTMKRRFPILKLEREDFSYRPRLASKLLGIGVPMGLQYSITAIGSVIVQVAINGLGTTAVAAVTAAGKISMFYCCMFDALATTMATYAGQNIGAKKLQRVHEGLRAASIIGIVYCLVALLTIWLFGRQLMSLFVDQASTALMDEAFHYLFINGIFYIPLLFVNIVRLSIQGMGYTRLAIFAGVFEMVARTLVAVAFVPTFGFEAACYANPVAWIFADAFLIPGYYHVLKQLKYRLYPAGVETDPANVGALE